MKKTSEKLPLPFKILQALIAIFLLLQVIILIITLTPIFYKGQVTYDLFRSVIESIFAIVIFQGLLKREKWAWILTIATEVLGVIISIFYFITGKIEHSFLWIGLGIMMLIPFIIYSKYYNRKARWLKLDLVSILRK